MTRSEFLDFARKHLEKHGLTDWTVKFNGRIKRAVGKCKPRKKRIDLAKAYFIEHESKIDTDILTDVVLHEIAHALDYKRRGTSDHSWKWKRVAREVGADPTRTCDLPQSVKKVVADWKRVCPNPECDFTIYYHSKPTASGKACPDCCDKHNGGRYTDEFEFEIRRN